MLQIYLQCLFGFIFDKQQINKFAFNKRLSQGLKHILGFQQITYNNKKNQSRIIFQYINQMFDYNDPNIIVQMCKFEAFIEKSHIVIKFPCSYFVQWKTINNRYSICTQKRVRTANEEAVFNQKLTFYTQMIYNTKKREYYSKETFLVLNLVSKSRPDQVKLVGRVSIDLAEIINKKKFADIAQMPLSYCSVQGSIVFSVTLLSKRDSNLTVKDLDRSAFNDYFPITNINKLIDDPLLRKRSASKKKSQAQADNNRVQSSSLQKKESAQRQSSEDVPRFASVTSPTQQLQKENNKIIRNDELMSFRDQLNKQINGMKQSREKSLIQNLAENNFALFQKQRINSITQTLRQEQKKQSRTHQNYTGNEKQIVDRVKDYRNNKTQINMKKEEQQHVGNIKRQIIVQRVPSSQRVYRVPSGQKIPKIASKQTIRKVSSKSRLSPRPDEGSSQIFEQPSTFFGKHSQPGEKEKIKDAKQSDAFSESSSFQKQQMLQIVQNLERDKQKQEFMIQQLKSMMINGNMKKKQTIRNQTHQYIKKIKQLSDENKGMRQQIQVLREGMRLKEEEIFAKNSEIWMVSQKFNELQNQLISVQEKCKQYEHSIALLREQNQQYKSIHQSLLISNSLNPSSKNQHSATIISSNPSKLIETFKLTEHSLPCNQQGIEEFQIRITKDQKIYQELEKENEELQQRINQLEQQNQNYKQLVADLHAEYAQYSPSSPNLVKSATVLDKNDTESPFTIMVSKNNNVYENYENLEQENHELYQKLLQMEKEIETYKDLLKDTNYPQNNPQCNQCSPVKITHQYGKQQLFSGVVQKENPQSAVQGVQRQRSTKVIGLQEQKKQMNKQSEPDTNCANVVSEPFKIVVTKDKKIYEQQQQQNIELSRRVIELEEEVEKYKELLRFQQSDPSQLKQLVLKSSSSIQKQEHYQNHGFTITLSKDNNIFQNQEKEISELYLHLHQLQATLEKYKKTYGPLKTEPQQKISIIREQKIYKKQQQQIKQLLRTITIKDMELQQMNRKISTLQKQIKELKPQNSGQIKINIKKDNNIYEQQQHQINELISILALKDDQVAALKRRISNLQIELQEFRPSNDSKIKINIKREDSIYEQQQKQICDLLKTLQKHEQELFLVKKRSTLLEKQIEASKPKNNDQIKININRDQNIYYRYQYKCLNVGQKR